MTTTNQGREGEREAFEKWAKGNGYTIERYICNGSPLVYAYDRRDTRLAWEAWQAARSTPPAGGAGEMREAFTDAAIECCALRDTKTATYEKWSEADGKMMDLFHRLDRSTGVHK